MYDSCMIVVQIVYIAKMAINPAIIGETYAIIAFRWTECQLVTFDILAGPTTDHQLCGVIARVVVVGLGGVTPSKHRSIVLREERRNDSNSLNGLELNSLLDNNTN